MNWLSTIKHADDGRLVARADGARRGRLPAADRRARGARGRLARARPRARRPTSSLLERVAGHRGRGRRRAGRRGPDDRPRRDLRRRRHRARPSARSRSAIGHGSTAARNVDAWLRGEPARRRAARPSPRPSTRSTPGTTPTRRSTVRPQLERARRESTFDEVVGGLDADDRALRGAPLPVVRQLLRLRQLLRRLPRQRRHQARPGAAPTRYAIDLDYCKGCGICARECPCGAIEMRPETV